MTFVCALLAILPLATPEAVARPRALVLDMRGDGVSAQTLRSITDVVTVQLGRDGRLEVISGEDVRNMAQLEADKQQIGCDDSCLVEIADALNADLVVTGFVGRLGSLKVLTLSLFEAKKARAVGRATVEVNSIEQLPDKLPGALDELLSDLPRPVSPMLSYGLLGGAAAAGGGALIGAAVAGVLLAVALGAEDTLNTAAQDGDVRAGELSRLHTDYVSSAERFNTVGLAAAWGGAVLVPVAIGLAIGGALMLPPTVDEGEGT